MEKGSLGEWPCRPPTRGAAPGLTAELFQTRIRACHLKASKGFLPFWARFQHVHLVLQKSAGFLRRSSLNCCSVPLTRLRGTLTWFWFLFCFAFSVNCTKRCSPEIRLDPFSKYEVSLNNFGKFKFPS